MSLPIRLDGILLRTSVALPLLLPMLPGEVLFYACEITQSSGCIMVRAGDLGADIHLLLSVGAASLLELPWQIMAPPVELEVLVSLEPLMADFTYVSVCRNECLG